MTTITGGYQLVPMDDGSFKLKTSDGKVITDKNKIAQILKGQESEPTGDQVKTKQKCKKMTLPSGNFCRIFENGTRTYHTKDGGRIEEAAFFELEKGYFFNEKTGKIEKKIKQQTVKKKQQEKRGFWSRVADGAKAWAKSLNPFSDQNRENYGSVVKDENGNPVIDPKTGKPKKEWNTKGAINWFLQTVTGTNQALSIAEAVCDTADDKDDGKLHWTKHARAIANGVTGIVGGMVTDENGNFSLAQTAKSAAMIGACFIPGVGPVIAVGMCAYGAWHGGVQIYNGIKNSMNATTDREAEAATEQIASGGTAFVASAFGAKAGAKGVKGQWQTAKGKVISNGKSTSKLSGTYRVTKQFTKDAITDAKAGLKDAVQAVRHPIKTYKAAKAKGTTEPTAEQTARPAQSEQPKASKFEIKEDMMYEGHYNVTENGQFLGRRFNSKAEAEAYVQGRKVQQAQSAQPKASKFEIKEDMTYEGHYNVTENGQFLGRRFASKAEAEAYVQGRKVQQAQSEQPAQPSQPAQPAVQPKTAAEFKKSFKECKTLEEYNALVKELNQSTLSKADKANLKVKNSKVRKEQELKIKQEKLKRQNEALKEQQRNVDNELRQTYEQYKQSVENVAKETEAARLIQKEAKDLNKSCQRAYEDALAEQQKVNSQVEPKIEKFNNEIRSKQREIENLSKEIENLGDPKKFDISKQKIFEKKTAKKESFEREIKDSKTQLAEQQKLKADAQAKVDAAKKAYDESTVKLNEARQDIATRRDAAIEKTGKPYENFRDLAKQKLKLRKEIAKLDKEISKLQKKIDKNPNSTTFKTRLTELMKKRVELGKQVAKITTDIMTKPQVIGGIGATHLIDDTADYLASVAQEQEQDEVTEPPVEELQEETFGEEEVSTEETVVSDGASDSGGSVSAGDASGSSGASETPQRFTPIKPTPINGIPQENIEIKPQIPEKLEMPEIKIQPPKDDLFGVDLSGEDVKTRRRKVGTYNVKDVEYSKQDVEYSKQEVRIDKESGQAYQVDEKGNAESRVTVDKRGLFKKDRYYKTDSTIPADAEIDKKKVVIKGQKQKVLTYSVKDENGDERRYLMEPSMTDNMGKYTQGAELVKIDGDWVIK